MNAILRVPSSTDGKRVSWCTSSDLEQAHAGLGKEEMRTHGDKFEVYRFPFSKLDRAATESESVGRIKVLANARGKVLGASILGANAGEVIVEYSLAIKANAGLGAISCTIHPYPTYALANRRTADVFTTDVLTPSRVAWIRLIFRLRGSTQGIPSLQKSTHLQETVNHGQNYCF